MTEIWQLFGGLFIALIFASSVGYILKRRSGYLYCEFIGLLWRNWALFDYFIYGIA